VTGTAIRFLERLAGLVLVALTFFGVASCGGGVSGNPPVDDPNRLTLLPGTGTILYSGVPMSFVVSGGTGNYIVTSSNPTVLAIPENPRSTFTVIPNEVGASTDVTITARDTGAAPLATAVVTVRPSTITNDIQITPSPNQGSDCPTGTLCSGGDATVTVTLTQAGVPLPNRPVRFDVVSGDFGFVTSPPGASPETVSTTTGAFTDSTGRATVRIRARAEAPNQTAILQVTDIESGAFRRVAINIAQSTGASPGFIASPSSYTFQGPNVRECANATETRGLKASFFIFGGVPPYNVTSPSSAFAVSRDTVSASGGSFDVVPNGTCAENVPITIRDSTGHTTTVTVSNILGTVELQPLVASPSTITLTSCFSNALVTAAGGTGTYVGTSGSDAIIVDRAGNNTFQIRRNPTSPASTSPVQVGISDGLSTVTVTVNLTGAGAGTCPTPPIVANPDRVTLTSCSGTAQVTVSGGTGSYSVGSNSNSIRVTISGRVVTIGRNPGNPVGPANSPPSNEALVTVTDGQTSDDILVTDNAGFCT